MFVRLSLRTMVVSSVRLPCAVFISLDFCAPNHERY